MAAAARQGARDVRLDRREEQVLTGMVMTGSTVVRKLGGSRAGEIAAHRFLDHEDVSPETTIAAAAERTRAAARGHTVLLIQGTTEINFSGADRSRTGLGPAGDGKALGFFIHPLLAVSLEEQAVLGIAHAQIWSRAPTPVSDRKMRPIEGKESMRWVTATAAGASFVGVAAEVIDVSDREGDIYQHFARRPDGVELVVRAHHDRKLTGGGQLFEAFDRLAEGFMREIFVAPRGPGDKGRTAKVRVRAGTVEIARPHTADPVVDPASITLGFVEMIETEPPAGKGVKPVVWRIVTTLPVTRPHEVAILKAPLRGSPGWWRGSAAGTATTSRPAPRPWLPAGPASSPCSTATGSPQDQQMCESHSHKGRGIRAALASSDLRHPPAGAATAGYPLASSRKPA